MKKLIFLRGAMGVGKTTVARALQKLLPQAAFLDGDWMWDIIPFTVTEETCEMALQNITALLSNFLRCSAVEHIIFAWVMHEDAIVDKLLARLPSGCYQFTQYVLTCDADTLRTHLLTDISAGRRNPDILSRAEDRRQILLRSRAPHFDLSDHSPAEAARELKRLISD